MCINLRSMDVVLMALWKPWRILSRRVASDLNSKNSILLAVRRNEKAIKAVGGSSSNQARLDGDLL